MAFATLGGLKSSQINLEFSGGVRRVARAMLSRRPGSQRRRRHAAWELERRGKIVSALCLVFPILALTTFPPSRIPGGGAAAALALGPGGDGHLPAQGLRLAARGCEATALSCPRPSTRCSRSSRVSSAAALRSAPARRARSPGKPWSCCARCGGCVSRLPCARPPWTRSPWTRPPWTRPPWACVALHELARAPSFAGRTLEEVGVWLKHALMSLAIRLGKAAPIIASITVGSRSTVSIPHELLPLPVAPTGPGEARLAQALYGGVQPPDITANVPTTVRAAGRRAS